MMNFSKWLILCWAAMIPFSWAENMHVSLTANEWPPYTSANIEGGGLVIELIKSAFAEEDVTIDYVIMPWARAMASVEAVRKDAVAAWYSEERSETFVFSDVLLINHAVMVKRKNSDIQWQELEDLIPYSFVLLIDAVNEEQFDQYDALDKTYVGEEKQALDMVIKKRVDMTVRDQGMVEYLIETEPERFAGKLDFVEKKLAHNALSLMLSKQHPNREEIIAHFNRGLSKIKENGRYQALLEKYNVSALEH
ncbi:MAG: transporter substrate-binding domain-containing protein [Marinomonas atlantica]|nr:transporter substrate-binding domain-containing protein [Marinomonas atlantica]